MSDRQLKDERGRTGCRVLNPDPDFWENGFPVWAICGPQVRMTLDVDDVLFFTPTVAGSNAARLKTHLCTGYLTVSEIVTTDAALIADDRFTNRYRRNYRIDLQVHLKDDCPRTRIQRPRNVIIGDPKRSAWLGQNGVRLAEALQQGGLRDIQLNARVIRALASDEVARLLAAIRKLRASARALS